MKKIGLISLYLMLCLSMQAQLRYTDAAEFPLLGKGTEATCSRYERFPDSLKTVSRSPLWELSRNSAGMAIRFCSNTSTVAVKWNVLLDRHMNHMTDVGVKGLDLYCWEKGEGRWRFVNSARPNGRENHAIIINNMISQMREYMLYLPLYDGVTSLLIGVDSLSILQQPKIEFPIRQKPVVFYGTSILQGGCASRPGMAHTNIIQRRLNRDCINFGFSGNAFLDLETARLMASIEAGVFVLDFVPNASVEQMDQRMVDFFRIIREKHPTTPIIFVEDPIFAHAYYCQSIKNEIERKNATLNRLFKQLKRNGEKNIYLIHSDNMIGKDGEATVDGIHFTDLGMMRYADLVCPMIKKLLKK